MGYYYEDFCSDAYEDARAVELDCQRDVYGFMDKMSRVRYWVNGIDSSLRKQHVNVDDVDWMLEQLYDILDMDISPLPLNILSKTSTSMVA